MVEIEIHGYVDDSAVIIYGRHILLNARDGYVRYEKSHAFEAGKINLEIVLDLDAVLVERMQKRLDAFLPGKRGGGVSDGAEKIS